MSETPPGWYPDANGTNRWFDGTSWTEHTQPAAEAAQAPVAPAPVAPAPSAPAPSAPAPSAPPADAAAQPAETGGWTPAYTPATSEPGYQPSSGQPGYGQPSYGQPGYGQPSYGPPSGGGSGDGKSSKGLLLGLGGASVLLAIGIVVALVLLFTGGDDTKPVAKDEPTTQTSSSTDATPDSPTSSNADPEPSQTTPEPTEPTEPSQTTDPEPEPTSGSPEQVTKGFMTALFSGDCKKAQKYVTGQFIAGPSGCDQAIPSGLLDTVDFTVGKGTTKGDTATVPVTIMLKGSDETLPGSGLEVSLSRSSGSWLVTNVVPA